MITDVDRGIDGFLDIRKEASYRFGADVWGVTVTRQGDRWCCRIKVWLDGQYQVTWVYGKTYNDVIRRTGEAFASGKVRWVTDRFPPKRERKYK